MISYVYCVYAYYFGYVSLSFVPFLLWPSEVASAPGFPAKTIPARTCWPEDSRDTPYTDVRTPPLEIRRRVNMVGVSMVLAEYIEFKQGLNRTMLTVHGQVHPRVLAHVHATCTHPHGVRLRTPTMFSRGRAPWDEDSAWVEPSEIRSLGAETGRRSLYYIIVDYTIL